MAKLCVHITKPGLHTTIQDRGRFGQLHIGVPANGYMDKESAQLANQLVGNEEGAPLLEITLIGPKISFDGSGQVAITGADLSPVINGESAEMYKTLQVEKGDQLEFGKPQAGCRAYIAIAGQWQIEDWLGSKSASAVDPEQLTPQSLIQTGTTLTIKTSKSIPETKIPLKERPALDSQVKVRVIRGPEYGFFGKESLSHFFGYWFKISQDANRMGYRLDKTLRGFDPSTEVISSGIVPGTIQITKSGQPIILMADAQTSGGYFRIANIISEDLNKVAQLKPGDLIGFELIDMI